MLDTTLEQKLDLLERAIELGYSSGLKPVRGIFCESYSDSGVFCGCALTAAVWTTVDPETWFDDEDDCELRESELLQDVVEDDVLEKVCSRFELTDEEASAIITGFDFCGTDYEFDLKVLGHHYRPSVVKLIEFGRRMAKRFIYDNEDVPTGKK